jgi:AcrR family transcriptional regulator
VTTARERVLESAQRLFARRGYPNVTIRQIAAEAGMSPAMVMKVGGSKERIYADATPPEPEPLDPGWPQDRIGRELVRRVLDRRDSGIVEPWLQALHATIDAPDPAAARRDFREHYLAKLERRLGGPDHDARQRAEVVAAMLVGLACAVGPLRILDADADGIVEQYGSMIQSVIDGAPAGSGPPASG